MSFSSFRVILIYFLLQIINVLAINEIQATVYDKYDIQPEKPFLVLDIDDTLITTYKYRLPQKYKNISFPAKFEMFGKIELFYILKRPGVESFLEKAYQYFNVVFYTNAYINYAREVLKGLMPGRDITKIYLISNYGGKSRHKDLKTITSDLKRIVLIDDNSKVVLSDQKKYFIQIPAFADDMEELDFGDYLSQLENKLEFWANTTEENWDATINSFQFENGIKNTY